MSTQCTDRVRSFMTRTGGGEVDLEAVEGAGGMARATSILTSSKRASLSSSRIFPVALSTAAVVCAVLSRSGLAGRLLGSRGCGCATLVAVSSTIGRSISMAGVLSPPARVP